MTDFQKEIDAVVRDRFVSGILEELKEVVPPHIYRLELKGVIKSAVLDAEMNPEEPVVWRLGDYCELEVEFVNSKGWRFDIHS